MDKDVLKKLGEIYTLQEKEIEQRDKMHDENLREFIILKEKVSKVEVQTTKTNGRVSSLENWRALLIGGGAIVILIVFPLVTYLYITQNKEIQHEINLLQK